MKRAIRWTVACFCRGDSDAGGPPRGLGCVTRGAGDIHVDGGIPGKRHLRKAAGEGAGDPRGLQAVRGDGRESAGQCGCGSSGKSLRPRGAPPSTRRCGARQCGSGDARPEIGRWPILGTRDDRAEKEGSLQRPAGGDERPDRFQCDLPGVGRRARPGNGARGSAQVREAMRQRFRRRTPGRRRRSIRAPGSPSTSRMPTSTRRYSGCWPSWGRSASFPATTSRGR